MFRHNVPPHHIVQHAFPAQMRIEYQKPVNIFHQFLCNVSWQVERVHSISISVIDALVERRHLLQYPLNMTVMIVTWPHMSPPN